jgi:hypothetical protein
MSVSPLHRIAAAVVATALTGALAGAAQAAPHAHTKPKHRAVASIQAERMSRSSRINVSVVKDKTASGRRDLRFIRAASARIRKTVVAATTLDIRASGDQCQGAPLMNVSVDGHRVGQVPVSSTGWSDYRIAAKITRHTHKIAIGYGNDTLVRGVCDRNLRVDKVSFVTPSGAAPSLSAPVAPAAPTGFMMGLVAGPAVAWETQFTKGANLHPKAVRIGFDIGASASSIESSVAALAAQGSQALLVASFSGTIPSTGQAQNLASWAHDFGPGGTFWQGRSDGNLAMRYIEFGNETNESYQFGGVSSGPSYTSRAQNYALRTKDAQEAIDSSSGNPSVGLIIQGDNGGCGCSQWVDGMFSAVPDLTQRIAGWTIHPYGPKARYGPILDQAVKDTAKHGDTTLPFFLTEYGISTDNGRCLDSNYNWPTCLTYQQAADDLHGAIADMRATYGSRIAAMYIYSQRDNSPTGTSGGRESYFGAVQSNGAPKGAWTTEIQNDLNAYRG